MSEASLRLNYVLSQDAYGAGSGLSLGIASFPVPDLAVGRLVETASEASGMLDAYLNHTTSGVVSTPTSSLTTGYDFMADTAASVATDLAAGLGSGATRNDTLITDPASPNAVPWTADNLRSALLGSRHDLVFLAGHFSANRALAADQTTTMSTTDLVSSAVDLQNAIVFSQGCHSGYGIVDGAAIPDITQPLDWAQAFARKRATLVGGTGYQYGDSELIGYSELIYASLAKELRTGTGPVGIGAALLAAKRDYLRLTPDLGGTDVKALLEATLYGLPMLSVNLPGTRLPAVTGGSTIAPADLSPVASGPGADLGLQAAPVDLTGIAGSLGSGTGTGGASYLTGPGGAVAAQPYQPVLPLITRNISVPGQVLRGVGFIGGDYEDTSPVTPLVSVPATDQGSGQTPFTSPSFYPAGVASVSYFDALFGGDPVTRLLVTPVQHRSDGSTATRRRFDSLHLQLFYSAFSATVTVGGQVFRPSLAAAPTIVDTSADETGGTITFRAHVSGDPAAGVQKVWITYTGFASTWTSLDLVQDPGDASLWAATLPVPSGHTAGELRYLVQAVNGTGLVSMDTNDGAFHAITPAPSGVPAAVTHVSFDAANGSTNPAAGTFGDTVTFSAHLSGASPLGGLPVVFSFGGESRTALTNAGGLAAVSWTLVQAPGAGTVTASYAGDNAFKSSFDTLPFTLARADTSLALTGGTWSPANSGLSATLRDDHGSPMAQRSVFFVIRNSTTPSASLTTEALTDAAGIARLGAFPLPAGAYTVEARFSGSIPLLPGSTSMALADDAYRAAVSGTVDYTAAGRARLTISFTVASKDWDGTTIASISACSLSGAPSTAAVGCSAASATASFSDAAPGTFKTVTGSGFTLTGADAAGYEIVNPVAYTTADITAVNPGKVLGSVATADAAFNDVSNGFDVLFSKGATTSVMTLRNTDPGTFHYMLGLDNQTGITLGSANGATSTTIITIPGVPASGVNVTLPASAAGLTDPAFTVQGSRPIRVHPDDDHDAEVSASVWYALAAPGGDCTAPGVAWIAGQPADGSAVKCVKIDGFALPKRHHARIDLNLEFRLKGTTGWLASQNPTLNFRAGFPFKSITSVTLAPSWGSMAGTYPGSQITGIVGVGQAVTAVGGFVFDTNGSGIGGAVVRVYGAAPSAANACTTTGQVAEFTTLPDGFYFVTQKGVNDASTQATGPSPLPAGIQYHVAVCNVPGVSAAYWPGRAIDHKLATKEFDGEDFYVAQPHHLDVTYQPATGKVATALGTIRVEVKDLFGYDVTADNLDTITLSAPVGSSLVLSGTLSVKVVGGVATFTNVKLSKAGTWSLIATAAPANWGGGTATLPIVIK
ncbi:MAG: YDG domain-containing protein [Chloroflexota bacterium]